MMSKPASAPVTLWDAQDVIHATNGRAIGGDTWHAQGISMDTRTLQPGDIFVALHGENAQSDGHNFVAQAFEKGAVAAIVDHDVFDGNNNAPSGALVVVEDTLAALADMARYIRNDFGGVSIGVTGSVGKTGTKEMLAACFGAVSSTYASRSSYNNHIGVPYSVASMPHGTDVGIFEMGMNHSGEITPLSEIVRPDIAIITTVQEVHMEHFNAVEEIADAKAEIFRGMNHNGIAILNQDNPHLVRLRAAAKTQGLGKIYTFGVGKDADARILNIIHAANGTRVQARIMDEEIGFTLQFTGEHHAKNALAVLLAVKLAGYDLTRAVKALEAIEPLPGRGLKENLNYGDPDNPVTLIDESYNASPVAMKAAFKVLALIDPGRGGRRIAVLGDMLELGESSAQYHRDLALPLKAANIDFVYTCGSMMKELHQNLPQDIKGAHKETSQELAEIVPEAIAPGDVVMVKGSLGSKMKVVVEALRAYPETLK